MTGPLPAMRRARLRPPVAEPRQGNEGAIAPNRSDGTSTLQPWIYSRPGRYVASAATVPKFRKSRVPSGAYWIVPTYQRPGLLPTLHRDAQDCGSYLLPAGKVL